ncbi:hypothetical protein BFW25_14345 [Aeromonas caviae]|nr:hypothetical protein BFW25_14345 [Aeromonas caviae]
MRHHENSNSLGFKGFHSLETFVLKTYVPNCKCFIYNQYLRVDTCLYCKRKTDIHTTGIGLDRLLHKIANVGKTSDFIKPCINILFTQSQDTGIEIDIITPTELRIKSSPQLKQCSNTPINTNFTMRRI